MATRGIRLNFLDRAAFEVIIQSWLSYESTTALNDFFGSQGLSGYVVLHFAPPKYFTWLELAMSCR